MCIHVGGKSIAPYLKKRDYDLSNIPKEKNPPDVFDESIDAQLLQNADKSWIKTDQLLGMNRNLVKYRTEYLIIKDKNNSTEKIVLNQFQPQYFPKVTYLIHDTYGYRNVDEELKDNALDEFPIITFFDDESDDSSSEYSG